MEGCYMMFCQKTKKFVRQLYSGSAGKTVTIKTASSDRQVLVMEHSTEPIPCFSALVCTRGKKTYRKARAAIYCNKAKLSDIVKIDKETNAVHQPAKRRTKLD
jgi:hypothetical protein